MYLHGALYAFLVNGFHELCHKTVFKTNALNIFFRNVYAFLGWYSHVSFWASHQAHHRYTLHPPDDLEVVLPVKLTLRSYLAFAFINPRGFYLRMKNVLQLCFGSIESEWELALFPPKISKRALFRWAAAAGGRGSLSGLVGCRCCCWRFYGGGHLLNEAQHIGSTAVARCSILLAGIEHHMYAAVPFYICLNCTT